MNRLRWVVLLVGALSVLALVLFAGLGLFRSTRARVASLPTAAAAASNDPAAAALARGDAAFETGDYVAAIAAYSDAITLKPDFAEAYNNRGLAHYRLNDSEAALADYNRASAKLTV